MHNVDDLNAIAPLNSVNLLNLIVELIMYIGTHMRARTHRLRVLCRDFLKVHLIKHEVLTYY